jgi:hypothetical protein
LSQSNEKVKGFDVSKYIEPSFVQQAAAKR